MKKYFLVFVFNPWSYNKKIFLEILRKIGVRLLFRNITYLFFWNITQFD